VLSLHIAARSFAKDSIVLQAKAKATAAWWARQGVEATHRTGAQADKSEQCSNT